MRSDDEIVHIVEDYYEEVFRSIKPTTADLHAATPSSSKPLFLKAKHLFLMLLFQSWKLNRYYLVWGSLKALSPDGFSMFFVSKILRVNWW